MTLKVVLIDEDEQTFFFTGIEIDNDFDMLYIETSEDRELPELRKDYKRKCYRLITYDPCDKLVVDDADEIEELLNREE